MTADRVFAWTGGGQITLAEALQAPQLTLEELGNFARNFASSIGNQIGVCETLERLYKGASNLRLKAIICLAYGSIKDGETFAEPVREALALGLHDSPYLAFMIDVGEEVGSLDKALLEFSEIAKDVHTGKELKGGLELRSFVAGLWLMQDAALPLLRSLTILSQIHPNESWKREIGLAARRVEKHAHLAQALNDADFFPKCLILGVGKGASGGDLEVALKSLLTELKQ